jgi:hypothetical protein
MACVLGLRFPFGPSLSLPSQTPSVNYQSEVSALLGWAQTLSSRLCILVAFRLLAFACSDIPYPLGISVSLAIHLPGRYERLGPHGAYHVPQ